jgi:hypothetical protein
MASVDTSPGSQVVDVDPISMKFAEMFFDNDGVSRVASSISNALAVSRSVPCLPELGSSASRSLIQLGTPLRSSFVSASQPALASIPSRAHRAQQRTRDMAGEGLMATGKPQSLFNPLDGSYTTPAKSRRSSRAVSPSEEFFSDIEVESTLSGMTHQKATRRPHLISSPVMVVHDGVLTRRSSKSSLPSIRPSSDLSQARKPLASKTDDVGDDGFSFPPISPQPPSVPTNQLPDDD